MTEEQEARRLLTEYGVKLAQCGLVQGTWGNLSVRLDDRYMLTTPSGIDYGRLTPEDMVKVEILTLRHEGGRKPTSEKGIHSAVYRRRPEFEAVIHTHSLYCSIFAAAHKDMPVEEKNLRLIFGDKVKLAAYGLPGSELLMENTLKALENNVGCIMANHGMLACGRDIEEAFEICRKMEECGRRYIAARFTEDDTSAEDGNDTQSFIRKPGAEKADGRGDVQEP